MSIDDTVDEDDTILLRGDLSRLNSCLHSVNHAVEEHEQQGRECIEHGFVRELTETEVYTRELHYKGMHLVYLGKTTVEHVQPNQARRIGSQGIVARY